MRRSPKALTAATLTVLALALTGCGVSGGELADTASTTSSTAAGSSTSGRSVGALDQRLLDALDATLAAPRFHLRTRAVLDAASQRVKLSADGRLDYDRQVADIEVSAQSGTEATNVDLRSNGTTAWIKPDAPAISLPPGKVWLQTTTDRLDRSGGFGPTGVLGVLLALRAAEGTTRNGSERIDGQMATGYSTAVNYGDVIDVLGSDASAFRRALSLMAPEPPDLDIDVWVGRDGIIRRFDLTIRPVDDAPLAGSYNVAISDVGRPVKAPAAPPAAEVLSGPEAERIVRQLVGS